MLTLLRKRLVGAVHTWFLWPASVAHIICQYMMFFVSGPCNCLIFVFGHYLDHFGALCGDLLCRAFVNCQSQIWPNMALLTNPSIGLLKPTGHEMIPQIQPEKSCNMRGKCWTNMNKYRNRSLGVDLGKYLYRMVAMGLWEAPGMPPGRKDAQKQQQNYGLQVLEPRGPTGP